METDIADNICGIASFSGKDADLAFSLADTLVTLIPLTDDARRKCFGYTRKENQDKTPDWIHGQAEDGMAIAFCRKSAIQPVNLFSGLGAAKFSAPIIVEACNTGIKGIEGIEGFEAIEFYGGIMDVLYNPDIALEQDLKAGKITFKDYEKYTYSESCKVDGEEIKLICTVNVHQILHTGKTPDLRNNIHGCLRLEFSQPQALGQIEKYYGYAMRLFQFCSGRLNVSTHIRLCRRNSNSTGIAEEYMSVKLNDGFADYAQERLDIMHVLRLVFMRGKLGSLFQLLNEDKKSPKRPCFNFLPEENKMAGWAKATDISDLCVALQNEFVRLDSKPKSSRIDEANSLYAVLEECIEKHKDEYSPEVVNKAMGVLSSNLKNFRPSLTEQIMALYDEHATELNDLMAPESRVQYGQAKRYTYAEFEKEVKKFVKGRNVSVHPGAFSGEGMVVYRHLEALVYLNVLCHAGFEKKEAAGVLSWMF